MDRDVELQEKITEILGDFGFEVHPFLIGWYNELVGQKFNLPYQDSTLAFIVISQPHMFENGFVPFLKDHWQETHTTDPIDQCMMHYFEKVTSELSKEKVVGLHDFQLLPNRRPKVLVQTAGHVSGAVRFYQAKDLTGLKDKNFYPVCHHPRWGGWFALRGVLIFEDISTPQLKRKEPPTLLSDDEASLLIEMYNTCWQDWRWRTVGNPVGKYSPLQIRYFETPPGERAQIIEEILAASS